MTDRRIITVVDSITAENALSVEFNSNVTTLNGRYMIDISDLFLDQANAALLMLFGTNGVFNEGSSDYSYGVNYMGFADGKISEVHAVGASLINVSGVPVSTALTDSNGIHLDMRLNPSGHMTITSTGNLEDSNSNRNIIWGGADCVLTNINSVKLFAENSALISGSFVLYEIM